MLKMTRPLRVRRQLAYKRSRRVPHDLAWSWGDRVFRNVARATGDHILAAKTANKVYWKIKEQEVA